MTVEADLHAGLVVAGRYRLEHELGRGGMGTVWAAVHAITGRRVAMKFLVPGAGPVREMRRRLIREARATALARHPNVVEVYDIFDLDDRTPVLVMALLVGETMARYLARSAPMTFPSVADLMLPVISAVGTAHASGVIHRDLKPDNIFLSHEGDQTVVRVLDFGIAKLAASDAGFGGSTITMPGYMLGTPCYMAPEQLFGDPDIDHRADVWSIGALLYEALAGVRAIEGHTRGEVFKRYVSQTITPISERIALPDDLGTLVMAMLAPVREDRPHDLLEIFRALQQYSRTEAPDFGPPGDAGFERSVAVEVTVSPDRDITATRTKTRSDRDRFGLWIELDLAPQVPLRLRWIPPGRFAMGSLPTELGHRPDEMPRSEVSLTQGFWLGETACTQAQWRAVMGTEPSRFRGDLRPVERVSWEDCHQFFRQLVARFPGIWLRLPTEAEWEYACRAGTSTALGNTDITRPDGEDPALGEIGWYASNSSASTQPVGRLSPNAFGLHDMLGNVWEWCHDIYGPYSATAETDPLGAPYGHVRVIRGGSWVNLPRLCRAASRRWREPTTRFDFVGFRVAAHGAMFSVPGT